MGGWVGVCVCVFVCPHVFLSSAQCTDLTSENVSWSSREVSQNNNNFVAVVDLWSKCHAVKISLTTTPCNNHIYIVGAHQLIIGFSRHVIVVADEAVRGR